MFEFYSAIQKLKTEHKENKVGGRSKSIQVFMHKIVIFFIKK